MKEQNQKNHHHQQAHSIFVCQFSDTWITFPILALSQKHTKRVAQERKKQGNTNFLDRDPSDNELSFAFS